MTAEAAAWPATTVRTWRDEGGQHWRRFADGREEPYDPTTENDEQHAQPTPVGVTAPAKDARPSLRSRVLTRAQLSTLPQPEPLITDTLDKRTVALLSGRRSTGKSFIALDWACCVATGHAWQGRAVAAPAPVLYVAAEGAHGLDQRVAAWEYAWKAPADALSVVPLPINLFKGGGIFDELKALIREEAYGLVVIDTWARSTVGGKENDNTDSTIAFERVDALRRLGPTVLVVAHTDGADTKTRGATALEDNADTVYRIKGDAGYLELERTKRKDGPNEDRHQLQLRVIDLKPGPDEFARSSCIVQNTRGQIVALTDRAKDLLSAFEASFTDTGCSKAELRSASGLPSATFARSLKALLMGGALVEHGTAPRQTYTRGATDA